MKIAFFTEMGFNGKIRRNHPNMRTEFAWMCALDAIHVPLNAVGTVRFDLGIVIVPKNNPSSVNIPQLKEICDKVGVMQEGPFWLYQDYDLETQIQKNSTCTENNTCTCHASVELAVSLKQ